MNGASNAGERDYRGGPRALLLAIMCEQQVMSASWYARSRAARDDDDHWRASVYAGLGEVYHAQTTALRLVLDAYDAEAAQEPRR